MNLNTLQRREGAVGTAGTSIAITLQKTVVIRRRLPVHQVCNKDVTALSIAQQNDLMVKFHLLDPSLSYTTQTWAFSGKPVIRIGRADSNDIVICQPIVSRAHVELVRFEDHWELVNLGRHGTFIEGESIERRALADGETFQLGQSGPAIRLIDIGSAKTNSSETITANATDFKAIDESEKERQVAEIAQSDYFRNLQQLAKKLKEGSGSRSTSETSHG